MTEGTESQSEVLELLREQNQLLKKILQMQQSQGKHDRHKEWFLYLMKAFPYLLLAVFALWVYFSVNAYLADLTQQVGEIKSSIGNVFQVITDQFNFIKGFFGNLLDVLKGFVPDVSGFADKVKEVLPGI